MTRRRYRIAHGHCDARAHYHTDRDAHRPADSHREPHTIHE